MVRRAKVDSIPITVPVEEVLGNSCAVCGSRKNLVIHHRNRFRLDNRSENLVLLCKACHAKIHLHGLTLDGV